MLIRLQKYDADAFYTPDKFMYTADTHSRATDHTAAHGSMEQNFKKYLPCVITETIPVSSNRLNHAD